jgi:hypothetical protein
MTLFRKYTRALTSDFFWGGGQAERLAKELMDEEELLQERVAAKARKAKAVKERKEQERKGRQNDTPKPGTPSVAGHEASSSSKQNLSGSSHKPPRTDAKVHVLYYIYVTMCVYISYTECI